MTVAKSQSFRNEALLVCCSGTCSCLEEDAENLKVAVCSGKVEWCGAFSTWASAGAFGLETGCIDVSTMEDEHAYALLAATGACGMQRQDAVEVAICGLTILESKLDQTDVASRSGIVQAQVGMHAISMTRGAAEATLTGRLKGGAADGTTKHLDGEVSRLCRSGEVVNGLWTDSSQSQQVCSCVVASVGVKAMSIYDGRSNMLGIKGGKRYSVHSTSRC